MNEYNRKETDSLIYRTTRGYQYGEGRQEGQNGVGD